MDNPENPQGPLTDDQLIPLYQATLKEKYDLIKTLQEQVEHYRQGWIAANKLIAALGWQPLTPETEWERATQRGAWNKASLRGKSFEFSYWYEGDPVLRLIANGYTHFRRLNPPAQEPTGKESQ